MKTETPIVEFRGVSKSFGSKVVLDKVDLQIYAGQVTTIIGKSGVGKSVLLKHIVGLIKPDAGQVLYQGRDLATMSREERSEFKRRCSYMFQNNALFDSLTVFENVALPLREKTRLSEAEIRQRVMARIESLELTEVPNKYPSQISGGMQKRVALARALITDPAMVLFDEPTTGLDPIRKNAVLSMIAHYQKRFGFTAILVSHDIPDVFYISNRVAILYEGTFVFQGPPTQLEQLDHPVIKEFSDSQQALKDELTGLDTRRRFERRFVADMAITSQPQHGCILLFTIENLGAVDEHVGHIAAQHILQSLATIINAQVGGAGYSARFTPSEILTVLPDTGAAEAEQVLEAIGRDLRRQDVIKLSSYPKHCFSFSVLAGVASGESGSDLQAMAVKARAGQHVLAQLTCGGRSVTAA